MGKDDTLRREWIGQNYLDTLIYLPENLLYATRIPVSIVVLKLRRTPKSAVQFVDLSYGEEIGRKRSQLGEALLNIAKQSIQNREPMYQRCKLVSQEELIANDCILNRERYFPGNCSVAPHTQTSLDDIHELQSELQWTQNQLEEYHQRFAR